MIFTCKCPKLESISLLLCFFSPTTLMLKNQWKTVSDSYTKVLSNVSEIYTKSNIYFSRSTAKLLCQSKASTQGVRNRLTSHQKQSLGKLGSPFYRIWGLCHPSIQKYTFLKTKFWAFYIIITIKIYILILRSFGQLWCYWGVIIL